MKRHSLFSLILCTLFLTACSGMPQLFWSGSDNKPAYARGNADNSPASKGRAPLDVPPELRDKVSVPMPDQVAVNAARGDVKISAEEKKAVAGKAVSLDTRMYNDSPAEVFSTTIDAMTALNLPVDSVDSPSGTITTTWIHPESNAASSYVNTAMTMIGGGAVHKRYRFIIRVFRNKKGKTHLQVRTLGQSYINHHWVFIAIKRKVANELFSAVEERLGQPLSDTDEPLPSGNP